MDDFKHNYIVELSKDVEEGLSAPQKYLKSKYFYDARGDLLFRRITHLPEYYLTACETEILHNEGRSILSAFDKHKPLNIIELGSGDGTKTNLLLEAAKDLELKITYYPIDISEDVLKLAKKNTASLTPVVPIAGDYASILGKEVFRELPNKLVLFLGSNIGNFTGPETVNFMNYLFKSLNKGEHALIGFDLVKDPELIIAAYNDPTGMTSDFNLNLLTVLNRELEASFDPDNFFHAPLYDQKDKAAKSYLVSNKKHEVFFKKLRRSFSFEKGEAIFTEISCKYSPEDVEKITKLAGFEIVSKHSDHRGYFLNVLLRRI